MFYSHNHDQLYEHIIHIHLQMHARLYAEHNDDTIKMSDTVLKKYTSHIIERVACEELETEQNGNILTPTLLAISVSIPFFWAAQLGAWGPGPSGCWFSLLHLISIRLIPNSQLEAWGLPLLGAGFPYRILSPTGLVSKLTDFLSTPSYL